MDHRLRSGCARPIAELAELGLRGAADRARAKLLESFPDPVLGTIALAERRSRFVAPPETS
jgi:hypothetical protein